jgi:hypothetical protein
MCSDRRREKSNSQTTKAKANLKSSHLGLGAKEEKKPMRDYPLIYFCISRKKMDFFGIDLAKKQPDLLEDYRN